MPVSHGFYDHEDDDGFHFATCICGWRGPPVPDIEDAADTYGDHRAALAARTQPDEPSSDSPLYDAWCVIANARDWLIADDQAQQWQSAAERWRDRNGFGAAVAGSATLTDRFRGIVTDLACTNSGHRTAVETLIERAREALAPALTGSATPTPDCCRSMEDGTPLTCEFRAGHDGPHSFDPQPLCGTCGQPLENGKCFRYHPEAPAGSATPTGDDDE